MNLNSKFCNGRVYQTYHSDNLEKLPLQKSIDAAAVDGHRHQLALDSIMKPWTDEFSTLVFSLGNSFRVVPLSERSLLMSLATAATQPKGWDNTGRQHLLTESNHPPLYFMLAHWWMQLWSPDSIGLASVWAARSLSALVRHPSQLSTECLFAFRSRVSQLPQSWLFLPTASSRSTPLHTGDLSGHCFPVA